MVRLRSHCAVACTVAGSAPGPSAGGRCKSGPPGLAPLSWPDAPDLASLLRSAAGTLPMGNVTSESADASATGV